MITTEFYEGAGLGNQLWSYVVTRVIALDHGYNFGIEHPEKFKGTDFLNIDFGKKVENIKNHYEERKIIHPLSGADIRTYDKDLVNVADNTKLDGYMQDEQYILHRKNEIREWLKVKKEYECYDFSNDDICVINFRGSGYVQEKDFFLYPKYWKDAVENMRKINQNFKFIVVTEDVRTAKKFFPDFEVFHFSIAKDYVVIKNAKYLILSNSSFAWFPAWTSNTLKYCIAPKYWGRHNISDGYWSLGYNITTGWMYQDRKGNLQDYDSCLKELHEYTKKPIKKTSVFNIVRKDVGAVESARRIIYAKGFKIAIRSKNKIWQMQRTKNLAKKIAFLPQKIKDLALFNRTERESRKTWLSPKEIVEYRKTIKIYDVFTFFNELDVLELRLNILDPYVDYFVLVEATQTFSGQPKPLYYQENKERFKKWQHKIIHYVVYDPPKDEADLRNRLKETHMSELDRQIIIGALTSDYVGRDVTHWVREFYIKECIKKALIGLDNNDICYLSDLDEVWNPNLIIDYTKDSVFKLRQIGYMYYLNNRSNEIDWYGWGGTIVTKYKNVRNTLLNDLRNHGKMKHKFVFLKKGGWHFAFQGGLEGAKRKIIESAHFWYNPNETLPNLRKRIEKNRDYRGRDIELWKDERGLPKYLLENKEKYKKFFK